MFLNLCAVRGFQVCRERFRKKIIQGYPILRFLHVKYYKISSENRFYLKRTNFVKEIDKREREFK